MSLTLAIAALIASPAAARADDEVKAAEQFDLGMAHKRAGDLAAACTAFARSERLAPAFGTKLNLADCAVRADHLLEAARLLRAAGDSATRDGDRARIDRANADLASVIALTPTIRFAVPAGAARATVDGKEVAITGATSLDPGQHEVVVWIDGVERVRKSVVLMRSALHTVELREPVVEPPPPPAVVEPPPPAVSPPDPPAEIADPAPRRSGTALALGLGAGAVVLAGAATYFTLAAQNAEDEAYAACPIADACPGTAAAARDHLHTAYVDSRIGLALFIGAGAAAAGATYVWWRGRSRAPAVDVRPTAGGAALTFGGDF